VLLSASVPSLAFGCGISTADGLSACSLQEHEEAVRPRWHVGASGVYTSTTIRFSGNLRSDETRSALVASLAYQPTARATFQVALGSSFGGRLTTPTGNHDFSPGPTAAVGASWRPVVGSRPFVVLGSNLAFSAATTQPSNTTPGGPSNKVGYQAFDLRLSAVVGTTLFRMLSPYAVGRVFGGPVFWRYQGASVSGGDAHHYQLGGGLALTIARKVNLFAEAIPLGERSVAAGATVAL
jgi:hypothetical protein